MSRHHKHFWVFALIYNCLLHQLSLGSPVFVRHFLAEGTGRNIRHLPCVSRRTGETGVCMFAFTCAKANGTHLGTCIDRFYFGSCCKLEDESDHVFPQDNTIDVDNPPLASKPFVTSTTIADSNDVPGNVDRLKATTASTTRLTEAPKTTTQTTQTTKTTQTSQTSAQTTRRPPTSFQPTTESIRLSTFQSVQNASEQRPQALPSLTTFAITRPTSSTPSSIPAFGQRITSKKPPFSSTYNNTKVPLIGTANTLKPQSGDSTRPRPSSSSSSSSAFTSPTSIRRNTTSSPASASTATAAKENLTTTVTTIPITVPTTIPTTILATRFPPRNATTPAPSKVTQATTLPSSAATTTKGSSTRKPTTTKKPIKYTTKRPNTPTKRPSSAPTTKRSPTAATTSSASPTKTSVAANSTPSSAKRPSSPTASGSKKPGAAVTKRPTAATSSTTFKPASPTTSASTTSKRPTGTTLKRPVVTTPPPTRRPVTSTPTSTTTTTTTTKGSSTSARPTTSSSTKPASTRPASTRPASTSAAPTTDAPAKVSTSSSVATGTSTAPSTLPTVTESTRRPSTQPVSTTEASRKPSTQSTSTTPSSSPTSTTAASTPGQKNATSHTTVSNELDAEFASEVEHATAATTTVTHGIVTWTSFSDDAETFTKPPETSTPATEATETLEWTPITTPDGWIIIQSPSDTTSSEKPQVEPAAQPKPGTTTTSPTVSPTTPSLLTAKPTTTTTAAESTTRQTTTTSTTSTTTTTTTQRPTTQPTTYVDALSTFATVSVSPDFSHTEAPQLPLNMTNYKDVCGRRLFPESRIVGGVASTFGKWPWQISLRQWRTSTYLHKCGAALLNENWAITAAHCVQNVLPSDLLLRLGEHDLGNEEEPYGFQERRVQIVASHPNFDPRTFEFDLALMRFYEPVLPFQPNVLPVCIPDNDEDYVGQTGFVTGWGRLYEDGPLPSVLQEVAVPVINNTVCEGMYRNAGYIEHIPHIFICAGWRKGGFDSCEGDSGGPLVIQRKSDKRWVLAGVISWGIGCAEPNQPGVYTRISEFREWINQILQF